MELINSNFYNFMPKLTEEFGDENKLDNLKY
jgi:hypothetical protein